MSVELLEKIRQELVHLNGVQVVEGDIDESVTTVGTYNLIPLDFNELIKEIDTELEIDNSISDNVMVNISEWSGLVTELSRKEISLFHKKESYNALSEEIIACTDFKAVYGKNNESIRKQHVKETLVNEYKEIKDLKFSIDYISRRISYLKSLIHTKTVLIEVKE